MTLNQKEFLDLFHSPRFRYIHDVTKEVRQGNAQLDVSLNDLGFGIFFTVNGFDSTGDATVRNIRSLNCNYVDIDIKGISQPSRDIVIQEKWMRAVADGVPMPTIIVRTKNGVHAYWMHETPIMSPTAGQITEWQDVQNRLIDYFEGDIQAKDPARVLRVPETKHLKDPLDPFVIEVETYKPENTYRVEELSTALPNSDRPATSNAKTPALEVLLRGVPIGQGLRHGALAQIAGLLLQHADSPEKIVAARENLYDWDRKIVGSPESWDSRKAEVDNTFESILKKELGGRTGQQEQVQRITTTSWGQIDSIEFPTNQWRVNKLIPKAGFVILASISGEGKTWVSLEIAKSIATGVPLFGEPGFNTEKGRVLYIDAENGNREMQRRGRQLGFADDNNLLFFVADTINLNDDAWCNELKQKIISEKIDVVIVDTFRPVAGRIQEEKAEDIRAFFDRYRGLKEYGVCFIWLDHFRKPERMDGGIPKKEHLFGSQDKTASAEVLLMMKKKENHIIIYQRKNRLDVEIKEFRVVMKDGLTPDNERSTTLLYDGEADEEESKKDEAREYIPEILMTGPKTTSAIKAVLQRDRKVGSRNVRTALKELTDEKTIEKRKKGHEDEYSLPEKLDEALQQFDGL